MRRRKRETRPRDVESICRLWAWVLAVRSWHQETLSDAATPAELRRLVSSAQRSFASDLKDAVRPVRPGPPWDVFERWTGYEARDLAGFTNADVKSCAQIVRSPVAEAERRTKAIRDAVTWLALLDRVRDDRRREEAIPGVTGHLRSVRRKPMVETGVALRSGYAHLVHRWDGENDTARRRRWSWARWAREALRVLRTHPDVAEVRGVEPELGPSGVALRVLWGIGEEMIRDATKRKVPLAPRRRNRIDPTR